MKIKRDLADVLIFVSAFLGAIPFALVGGFMFLKAKGEGVKAALKTALMLFLAFVAADALIELLATIFNVAMVYNVIGWLNVVLVVAKIIAFALFAMSAYMRKSSDEYTIGCCCEE